MYVMDVMTKYHNPEMIYDVMADLDKTGATINPDFIKARDVFGYNLTVDKIANPNGYMLGSFRVRETEKSFIIYTDIARISKKKLILHKLKGEN